MPPDDIHAELRGETMTAEQVYDKQQDDILNVVADIDRPSDRIRYAFVQGYEAAGAAQLQARESLTAQSRPEQRGRRGENVSDEWRVANPHTSWMPPEGDIHLVDIREGGPEGDSRFVCTATPEDAARILEALRSADEMARLRATLEYYADPAVWEWGSGVREGQPVDLAPVVVCDDAGDRARAALAPAPPEGRQEAAADD